MARATSEHTLEKRIRRMTPVAAPASQRAAVEAVSAFLVGLAHPPEGEPPAPPRCELVGPEGRRIPIPDAAFFLFERVAEVLARGDSITIVPIGKELTTQQAADLLNVSRQYLVRLLDEKRLPCTKLGKHRRLRIEDVLAFKDKRDEEQRAALEELTQLSEDAGGYSEIP